MDVHSTGGQSRKRVEFTPIHFVEEKKSYFKEVDSFELDEEESPSPVQVTHPRLAAPSKLVPLQNLAKDLDVEWEESGGESFSHISDGELSSSSDLHSPILKTPALSQSSASSDILISSNGFSFHKIKPSSPSSDILISTDGCSFRKVKTSKPPPDESSTCKIKSSSHMSLKELTENQDVTAEGSDRGGIIQEPVNTQSTVQENRNKSSFYDESYISEVFGKMQIIGVQNSQNFEECTELEGKYVEEDSEAGVTKLLQICGQTRPMRLFEAFSEFCDANNIIKIGEGTFGEAFKGGGNVFKIVPFGGDSLVNGEAQKTCAELVTEVSLSKTLNRLRSAQDKTANDNTSINFIETKAIRVCEGTYDAFLVNAWEDWDEKHTSENDHPMAFPEKQLYATFILADGGQDLESFVLLDFDEARSLLVQVTSSLAIAEAACEFEHRDLHWGNILLSRDQTKTIEFILQGKRMEAQTFGLTTAIIDFTLSRINTGNQVLYFDLSSDPALFEGPKRTTQSETYRRMLDVTKGNWEGRYPKTNSLWLHYIADTLLTKKVFRCSPNDKRCLQAFRKRLLMYDSAEAALSDAFFDGMWVEN